MNPIRRFIQSIVYSGAGVKYLFNTQRNFRDHLLLYCSVLVLGFFLDIETVKLIIVLVISVFVFLLEALNTVVEEIFDFFHPRYHRKIGHIKDAMAGIVLMAGVVYLIVCLVFYVEPIINIIFES